MFMLIVSVIIEYCQFSSAFCGYFLIERILVTYYMIYYIILYYIIRWFWSNIVNHNVNQI